MLKTVVLNVVGLTQELIGEHTPFLLKWSGTGKTAYIKPCLPAVTCSVQSCYVTGKWPTDHGIVGNGWYFRDECEVKFWRQSNKLVQGLKIWDVAKKLDPNFTCSNMFWWYDMYLTADTSATPRPIYAADGRKFSDCYTFPPDLRDKLQAKLGTFPLFDFWGPKTSIKSSRWIGEAAMYAEELRPSTLTLIYLPHLDYELQRVGPHHANVAKELKEIDDLCKDLITFYEGKGAQVIVLSEYGITEVSNPISLNRILRKHGYIQVREELGHELLDAGACQAFAVADHQLAHIYVNDQSKLSAVRELIEKTPGVEAVYGEAEKQIHHIDHPRAGDLIAIADAKSWFTYYFWLDDNKAPDYARTVDIHRKPGYDPAELVVDPTIKAIKLKVLTKLFKKKIGMRYLLDVIPLDASIIKGSHGRYPDRPEEGPLIITQQKDHLTQNQFQAVEIYDVILKHLGAI